MIEKILLSDDIMSRCPEFVGTAIEATVVNTPFSDELWRKIHDAETDCRTRLTTETAKKLPAVAATREAYRRCGKDPSRYRPSAESLMRRVLKNTDLYQISTVVDLINLASLLSGYSIGGFDAALIDGNTLTLGIGLEGEPYEGIGRGTLNIAGMPVYRDATGGIGTPTSDNERTKLSLATTRLLVIVNGYDGDRTATIACADLIADLLRRYASATDIVIIPFP